MTTGKLVARKAPGLRWLRALVAGTSIAILAGCDSAKLDGSIDVDHDGVTAADLCVSAACGERSLVLDLPSAENLVFSPDGRLFVSGGLGVFEIHRDALGVFHAETGVLTDNHLPLDHVSVFRRRTP